MGLALQGSPPLFPVADFFLVPQLFISLGGRTGVESAQWVSVRGSPGTWHFVGTPAACDSLPAFVECFPGQGPVGPFLDGVFQD